ncbi:antiviral innate immune response receptor RIG-I-like [Branchiostoma floridae]|uniref:RNA helicase n=1 Tax=Branchiostoma floridae TaxID=7739 RepID=A0A9J7KZE6_BRAFL|nr:antiviral innate immune response receptor RIG-I-like [Branchiostoma floridae]
MYGEPRVFIIHAGEDKEPFVRPLVTKLQQKGLAEKDIFFDDVSIKPGDVIRERILSTLSSQTLELAVIVVSTSFLNKPYWPKLEYETCLKNNKRIFPIWVDANNDNFKAFSELVGKYSPTLKQLSARRVKRDNVTEELPNIATEVLQRLSTLERGIPKPTAIQTLLCLAPSPFPTDSGSSDEDDSIKDQDTCSAGVTDEQQIEDKLKDEKEKHIELLGKVGGMQIQWLKDAESLLPREMIVRKTEDMLDNLSQYSLRILKVKMGCAIVHLVPDSVAALDMFWRDYKSGQLSINFSDYLLTDEMRTVVGKDLMVRVIILEEQYRQWKRYFQKTDNVKEDMAGQGTDTDIPWVLPELKARLQLIINSHDVRSEAAERIAEVERKLVLSDPQIYRQIFKTFLGHSAVILKTGVGSLLLSFFRISDVERFYHTYSRTEPGSLSVELSKVLVSKQFASVIGERNVERLSVRIHVDHEDYQAIRKRLRKGLVRSTSLESLQYSIKPKKTSRTCLSKCIDALNLASSPRGKMFNGWESDMAKLLQQSAQKKRQLMAKLEIAKNQESEKADECLGLKVEVRRLLDMSEKKDSMKDELLKTKEQLTIKLKENQEYIESLEKDKKSMQERTETLQSQILKLENKLALLEDTREPTGAVDTDITSEPIPTGDELGMALLEAFGPLLKETVIPGNIIIHLMAYFDGSLAFVKAVIADERNKGPAEAMQTLLVKLQTCEQPGWFQAFLDSLDKSGYSHIKTIMEDRETIQDMTGLNRLLQLLAPQLQVVVAMEMLPHLPCLSEQDKEKIEAENRSYGNIRALITLIDRVTRCGPDWYTQFLEGLRKSKHQDLADELAMDPDLVYRDVVNKHEPLLCVTIVPEKMLPYLKEVLTQRAMDGNEGAATIVGAGVEARRRVVFLVNKVPLVEQQYNAFREYLSPKYDILPLSGETTADIPVGETLPDYDVIILTAQVLENALRDELITLDTFSMLIFDEYHHCQKNDPCNAIMTRYIKQKVERKSSISLPQIIGLTASLGVGKAKGQKEAVEHILRACANLDAEWISQVVEHKEELQKYNQKPDEEVKPVSGRSEDPFADMINMIMEDIEKTLAIEASKHLTTADLKPPSQREKQAYEQWVVTLARKGATLRDKKVSRAIHAATTHLRKYFDALAINADARTKDALQYLEKFVTGLQKEGFDGTDVDLVKHFTEAKERLQECAADPKYSNPKLDQLKYMILQAYAETPDSRCLLFCKTRALTIALLTWMQEDQALRKLNPGRLVGAGASESTGGMTQNQQVELLELFTTGGHKIVISTSVAEEGIDIAKCNFVFRYDYVGNEIGKVQTRGRGRAEGSKSVLIAGREGGNVLKEKLNTIREKLMEKAMLQVWHMQREKHEDFMKQVRRLQEESKKERDLAQALKEMQRKTKEIRGKGMKLLCVKCKEFACNVSDFRRIKENHHVVVDKTFPQRINIKPHPPKKIDDWEMNGKVYCRNCRQDWGIQMVYSFPTLKIESFVLEKPDGSRLTCRKWKNAPFDVEDITPDDISGMLGTPEEEEEDEPMFD